jgi:hypothetical protein
VNPILATIEDQSLTYQQKLAGLARLAENSLSVLTIDPAAQAYREAGVICDLFEGEAPYRPRYIVPDYERFMRQGSDFLGVAPPKDIWEATAALLILYRHVPSITTFPVYLGDLDALLEPFVRDEARRARP